MRGEGAFAGHSAFSRLPPSAAGRLPTPIGRGGFALRRLPTVEERRRVWAGEIARERGCGGVRRFGGGGGPTCFVGFSVGVILPPEDNADLVVYSTQVLAEPGPVQDTWAGSSGDQVTLTTSEAAPQEREVTFAMDEDVDTPPAGVKVEPATYVVVSNTLNFRSSPTTASDNNKIGFFSKNDNVEVMGRTPDGEWALVGDEGVVVGYAKFRDKGKTLLETPADAQAAEQRRAHPRLAVRPTKGETLESNLGESSTIRVAENLNTKTAKVVASTQCKAITATRGAATDTKTGCAQPDGGWVIG